MPDSEQSFIKALSDSAIGGWVSLISNLLQIGQYLWGEIVGGPGTEDILRRLDDIAGEIASAYLQLRDLTLRESARIIERIDIDTYRVELARASTAYANLKEYRRANNQGNFEQDVLAAALSLSKEPCDFFALQNTSQVLASFIFSVQIRIDVLRSAIAPPYYTQRLYVQEVNGYIDHLNDLINDVVQGVDQSHQCVQTAELHGKLPNHGFAKEWWLHQQVTRIYAPDDPFAPGTTTNAEIRRIEYLGSFPPPNSRNLPTEEEARAECERDRERGVIQELAYLGIPAVIGIRDAWRRLLEQGTRAPGRPPTA